MGKRRGRGEGAVEQMPDGRWRVVLSLGIDHATSKRRRRRFYASTKNAALDKANNWRHKNRNGKIAGGDAQLGDWLTRWLAMKKGTIEDTSLAVHDSHVRNHLAKAKIAQIRLEKLTPLDVADLYADLERGQVSAQLQSKVGTTLRMALADAQRMRLVVDNVAKEVARPKSQRAPIHPLTPEQVGKFLATITGHRREAMYRLALDSGMRQGELFGLLRDCVDDDGTVTVKRSLAWYKCQPVLKDVKTNTSRRRIRVSPQTAELLRNHLATRPAAPDTPVFVTLAGRWLQPPYISHHEFKGLLNKAGLPRIRFHDLRHTCATLLLLKGINVKAVSARLGHSSVVITLDCYSHVLPAMDDQVVDVMRDLLMPVGGMTPGLAPEVLKFELPGQDSNLDKENQKIMD